MRLAPLLALSGAAALTSGAAPSGCSARRAAVVEHAAPASVERPSPTSAIAPQRFCPTSGRVDAIGPFAMRVNGPGLRGVAPAADGDDAEITFSYRGPSERTAAFGDGTIRRQIGLKLRAQDTCNVVYVMWHVAPTPQIGASVKWNPGRSTHAECRDGGYINLRGSPKGSPELPVEVGAPRTLRARVVGDVLDVAIDGVTVWEAALPPEARALRGPAGVRADNGVFDFELRARASSSDGCERVRSD